jgi:hypothetical protein
MPLFFYKYFQRTVLYRQTKMAVFGKIDSAALPGGVAVTQNTNIVTGPGGFQDPADPNYIDAGDIIEILPDRVPYVVRRVESDTQLILTREFEEATVSLGASNAFRRTAPKAVAAAVLTPSYDSRTREILYVDLAEAQLESSRKRGLKIPGWHVFETFLNGQGDTVYHAECIAAVKNYQETATGDDNDDANVADTVSVITIDAQPAISGPAEVGDGTPLTITAEASTTGQDDAAAPATISFQWQRQKRNGGRWANVTANLDGTASYANFSGSGIASPATAALTLTLNPVIWDTDDSADGYEYRLKVTNNVGGLEEVTTTDAVLVVTTP